MKELVEQLDQVLEQLINFPDLNWRQKADFIESNVNTTNLDEFLEWFNGVE